MSFPSAEQSLHSQPDRVLVPVLANRLAFYYLLFTHFITPHFITPPPKEKNNLENNSTTGVQVDEPTTLAQ